MHTMQGLLWEQWRQSRLWIVGSGAFLIMMTFGVWLNHDWIMRHSSNDPFELDKLAWVIGFTAIGLLFVNQRIREVTLQFPRRQFALPCRTLPLVASHLLFKSLVAVLLGVLIAVYHCALFAQAQPSALAIYLLLALVAGVQALVMLAAIFGPWPAVLTGAAICAAALSFFFFLNESGRLDDPDAAAFTCLAVGVAGWAVSLACGPAARHGRGRPPSRVPGGAVALGLGGYAISVQLFRPVAIQWNFASPLWAQCWYEWRRVLVWMPRILAPAALLCGLVWLGDEGDFALALQFAASVATAATCSYFLLRLTPAEARFVLARPEGGRLLADGKLLSALMTVLLTTALTATILVLAIVVAVFLGEQRAADFAVVALPWILLAQAAILWVALTSAPVYLAAMIAWGVIGLPLIAPLTALGGDLAVFAWIYVAVLLGLAIAAVRWLRKKGVPIPWELGLVALTFVLEFLVRWGYPSTAWLYDNMRMDHRVGFLAPLFLLQGGLLFTRRLGLLSVRRVRWVLFFHLVVVLAFLTVVAAGVNAGPITAPDVVFWWIAACFAPLVWMPLSIRVQQYR